MASGRNLVEETKVPAAHASYGGWANDVPLDHPAPPLLSTPAIARLSQ